MAKDSKGKKGAAAPDDDLPRLSAHPRARAQIGMAKAWAGLIGFAVVTLLSRGAEVPWFDALVRGLAGGIVAYVVAWTVAVVVWRHLARAELELLRRRTEERIREEQEAAEAARKAAESGDAGAA